MIHTTTHAFNSRDIEIQYGDIIDVGDNTKYMVIEDTYGDYPTLILRLSDMKITNGFSCLEDITLNTDIRSVSRDYVITITNEKQEQNT